MDSALSSESFFFYCNCGIDKCTACPESIRSEDWPKM